MKEYRLVGPNHGKSVRLGSFDFVDGKILVEDSEVTAVGPIVERFYSAVPAEQAEKAQAEYEKSIAPPPAVNPTPVAVVEEQNQRHAERTGQVNRPSN